MGDPPLLAAGFASIAALVMFVLDLAGFESDAS